MVIARRQRETRRHVRKFSLSPFHRLAGRPRRPGSSHSVRELFPKGDAAPTTNLYRKIKKSATRGPSLLLRLLAQKRHPRITHSQRENYEESSRHRQPFCHATCRKFDFLFLFFLVAKKQMEIIFISFFLLLSDVITYSSESLNMWWPRLSADLFIFFLWPLFRVRIGLNTSQ